MKEALELEIRSRIYHLIQQEPGIHFREIARRLGIGIGALSYHIRILEKLGIVASTKRGKVKCLFPAKLSAEEQRMLTLLRSAPLRKIIIHLLLSKNGLQHNELVKITGLSPGTITWHTSRLKQAGIIESRGKYLMIKNKEEVSRLLIAHQESFIDKLVDHFVEMWAGG